MTGRGYEFVASDAGDEGSLGGLLQTLCDDSQRLVSLGVAEHIVDLLEAIEIDAEDCKLPLGLAGARERSLQLLTRGGAFALLVPSKLWCSLAGGGVRRLIADEARLRRVEDYSEALCAFDAAVYPSLVVAERPSLGAARATDIQVAVSRANRDTYAWTQPA